MKLCVRIYTGIGVYFTLGANHNMDRKTLHLSIVICVILIAAYASFMTVRGISGVYQTSASFFEGSNPSYPWVLTLFVAIVPLIMFLIALLIYNNKPIVVTFLAVYSLLAHLNYPSIILVFLVAVWWLKVYSPSAPNTPLKRDLILPPK